MALPTAAKAGLAALTFPPLAAGIAGIAAGTAILKAGGINTQQAGGKTMPTGLGISGLNLIPGYDVNWENIIPGGAPFITPEGPAMSWTYSHTANGINFYRFGNKRGCYNSKGVWKQWAVYHPIVFGKHADGAKLARIIKKHRSIYKELNKVFGKRERATIRKR